MKTTFRLLVALSLITLAGCDKQPAVSGDVAAASTSDVAKPQFEFNPDSLQQIDVQSFIKNDRRSFSYINEGRGSECFVHDNVVTCWGNPDNSVPEIEVPPFPKQKPHSISLATNGLAYTLAEGVPPAQRELRVGEWVDFGNIQCAKPDTSTLICRSKTAAFAIVGPGMTIHTHGKIFADSTHLSTEPIHEGGEYSQGSNALVTAPMMCGAKVGRRLAEVVKGEMSCEEAMTILDRYDEAAHTQGQGNTLAVQIDGWMCNSPTAARAQELMASTVCVHPERGLEVRDPKFPTF